MRALAPANGALCLLPSCALGMEPIASPTPTPLVLNNRALACPCICACALATVQALLPPPSIPLTMPIVARAHRSHLAWPLAVLAPRSGTSTRVTPLTQPHRCTNHQLQPTFDALLLAVQAPPLMAGLTPLPLPPLPRSTVQCAGYPPLAFGLGLFWLPLWWQVWRLCHCVLQEVHQFITVDIRLPARTNSDKQHDMV